MFPFHQFNKYAIHHLWKWTTFYCDSIMLVCVQLIITTVMWLQFHYCDTIHKTRSKPKHGPFTRCTWFSRPCVSHGRCQLTDSTPSGWLIKHPKLLLAVDDAATVQRNLWLACNTFLCSGAWM